MADSKQDKISYCDLDKAFWAAMADRNKAENRAQLAERRLNGLVCKLREIIREYTDDPR